MPARGPRDTIRNGRAHQKEQAVDFEKNHSRSVIGRIP